MNSSFQHAMLADMFPQWDVGTIHAALASADGDPELAATMLAASSVDTVPPAAVPTVPAPRRSKPQVSPHHWKTQGCVIVWFAAA